MLAACGHLAAIPPLPSQGGPAWIELQSAHFTLWTDASSGRARELLADFERHRQVVLGVGFNYPNVAGRTFVVALRDSYEFHAYAPDTVGAYAWVGDIPQPSIVLPVDIEDEWKRHVVVHELSHAISLAVIRNQPLWFGEGLAEFFASVEVDPATGKGTIGKAPKRTMELLRRRAPVPVSRMFKPTGKDELYYPTAWAMFAYLANVHPDKLMALGARLDAVESTAKNDVFAQVFPELTPERFDRELKEWLYGGKHKVWPFSTRFEKLTVVERPLVDADVHAARALLLISTKHDEAKIRAELAAALKADENHVLAQLLVGIANKDRYDVAIATRVATAHPEDWRAAWLVYLATKGTLANYGARTKLCAVVGREPGLRLPPNLCAASEETTAQ